MGISLYFCAKIVHKLKFSNFSEILKDSLNGVSYTRVLRNLSVSPEGCRLSVGLMSAVVLLGVSQPSAGMCTVMRYCSVVIEI